jgi:hypothetical protein
LLFPEPPWDNLERQLAEASAFQPAIAAAPRTLWETGVPQSEGAAPAAPNALVTDAVIERPAAASNTPRTAQEVQPDSHVADKPEVDGRLRAGVPGVRRAKSRGGSARSRTRDERKADRINPATPDERPDPEAPPAEPVESAPVPAMDAFPMKVFDAVWPVLQTQLGEPRSKQELAVALELREPQVLDWLDRAVREGKAVKIPGRPVRYQRTPTSLFELSP